MVPRNSVHLECMHQHAQTIRNMLGYAYFMMQYVLLISEGSDECARMYSSNIPGIQLGGFSIFYVAYFCLSSFIFHWAIHSSTIEGWYNYFIKNCRRVYRRLAVKLFPMYGDILTWGETGRTALQGAYVSIFITAVVFLRSLWYQVFSVQSGLSEDYCYNS